MNNVKSKFLFLLIILLCSCSFGLGGNVWNDLSDEIERAKERKNSKIIFSTQKRLSEEILNTKKIELEPAILNKNWIEKNFSSNNYVPHLLYKNNKNLIFKSKKIGKNKFDVLNEDFEPLIENEVVYFYDPSGTVYSYSLNKKNKLEI